MAYAYQWLNSRTRHPVFVVAGRSFAFVSFMVNRVLDVLPGASRHSLSAKDLSVPAFLERIWEYTPLDPVRVFVVSDISAWKDTKLISEYVKNPKDDTFIILTADSYYVPRKGKVRWVAAKKGVQTIDCGNMSEPNMLKFISHATGCPAKDAQKVMRASLGDMDEILRLCGLLSVLDGDYHVDMVTDTAVRSKFDTYGLTATDGYPLMLQALSKMRLILEVSLQLQAKTPAASIPGAVGIEPYQMKGLISIARQKPPAEWLSLLSYLQEGHRYSFQPSYPAYLEAVLP